MKIWDRSHEPIFRETTVHYIFTWSAEGPMNIRTMADKLLAQGIAETVGSPAYPEVRVSPRIAPLGKHVRDLRRVKGLYNIQSHLDLIKWVLRNPVLAAKIFRLMGSSGETPLGPQPKGENGLEEVEQQIKQIVWNSQVTNAVQHSIESELYSSAYLQNEPYLRLTLHGFPCWLDITDGGIPRQRTDASGCIMAEVLLLIHQSGCIQLTVVLQLPDSLSTDALTSRVMAKNVRIARSEIAEPVLRESAKYVRTPESSWSGNWAEGEARGVRRRAIDHEDDDVTLVDFFEMYRDAIERATNTQFFGEWRCYPVVFIDSLGCCGSEPQWMRHHKNDLTRLVSGAPRLPLRKPLPLEDQALVADISVYCEIGWTTKIRWKFLSGRSDFAEQLQTVVVIEHALLRFWQLVALTHRITSIEAVPKSMTKVQREAIFGLQEYRRVVLVFGSANEMANRLLFQLGEHEMYSRILESLGLLQKMIADEVGKRSARTQNTVAAAAIFATVILGLPSIETILSTAKSVPRTGVVGQIVYPFHVLAGRGAVGVWEGYLALLAIVVVVVITSIIRRRKIRVHRSSAPGVFWRYGTVQVVRDNAADEVASSTDQSTTARHRPNSKFWSGHRGSLRNGTYPGEMSVVPCLAKKGCANGPTGNCPARARRLVIDATYEL